MADSWHTEIQFLTLEEIEVIHADQLARYGGPEGYRNKSLIESAVESPKQTMFGAPLYTDIAEMASVYFFQIGQGQGFTDGNKRTGVAACLVFLARNGYELNYGGDELYNVALRVANKKLNRKALAKWIRQKLIPAE